MLCLFTHCFDFSDLLQDAQENCVVQARELPLYPECFSKIEVSFVNMFHFNEIIQVVYSFTI